jgi:NAD(P)H-hydrate epimerase
VIRDVWPLVTAGEMRSLDRYTIETLGVPGELLMESAGRATAASVLEVLPDGGSVLVVCGGGNNGGDGLVAARQLHAVGVPVRAAIVASPDRLSPDAAANLERARRAGVTVAFCGPDFEPRHGVIVDALFGTGLDRPVEGDAEAAIRRINASRAACRVVAVDLPSGLHADTGQVLGAAVEADVTLTLGLPKLALALEPGRSLAGRVRVARIGIADHAPGVSAGAELWPARAAAVRLPERAAAGHKGSFGHVLVVGGSEGKTGAAALAAAGAASAGAGLVTVACPRGVLDVVAALSREAMTAPLPETRGRALCAGADKALLALAHERDVVVMGPGLGRDPETQSLLRAVAPEIERPLVLDADALFAFGDDPSRLMARAAATILTPHPGEAGRLLGISAREVNADRVGAARRLAAATGAVALVKGAGTVTASPDGRATVNPTGGPALASGGTGDVLAGMLAALLAQGLSSHEAAALGAWVHGHAGDRITARAGASGLLAGELAREVPAAMESLRSRGESVWRPELVVAFPEPG